MSVFWPPSSACTDTENGPPELVVADGAEGTSNRAKSAAASEKRTMLNLPLPRRLMSAFVLLEGKLVPGVQETLNAGQASLDQAVAATGAICAPPRCGSRAREPKLVSHGLASRAQRFSTIWRIVRTLIVPAM